MINAGGLALALLLVAAPPAARPDRQCVPPEMPAYAAWELIGMAPGIVPGVDGTPVRAMDAWHRIPGKVIRAWWIDGMLAAVDPSPEDRAVSIWVDDGIIDPEGFARPDRAQACRWRRPIQTPPGERT